jgi:hypothetical protein
MSDPTTIPTVNSHIHTPHSFSCFDSVRHAAELAAHDGVQVLGISDFNTVEGYAEFGEACAAQHIYPMYGIEFIAFSREDKAQNLRWNDPKNPGIIYFCGKGLDNPVSFDADSRNTLAGLWKGTQDYIWQVIDKLNTVLAAKSISVTLSYNDIRSTYAKNTVRERHVTKALFHAVAQKWPSADGQTATYRTIFGDTAFSGAVSDSVYMQNEIRNRLLKAGKAAYVEENIEGFLNLHDVMKLILSGGGIPCYPVLVDDSIGLNEHESDPATLSSALRAQGIHAVEFIPLRNTLDHLKRYVSHFAQEGFLVHFGTEHNTPELYSTVPAARKGAPLDESMRRLNYRSACVVAAHQRRRRAGQTGFVNARGEVLVAKKDMEEFVALGDRKIREATRRQ